MSVGFGVDQGLEIGAVSHRLGLAAGFGFFSIFEAQQQHFFQFASGCHQRSCFCCRIYITCSTHSATRASLSALPPPAIPVGAAGCLGPVSEAFTVIRMWSSFISMGIFLNYDLLLS